VTAMWSRITEWGNGLFSRAGGGALQASGEVGLPVNLGSYDYAKNSSAQGKIQNIDQALLWVVVALLMWGMIMVYSASIAMPDNPKFARYAQTHFLMRHVISIVIGFGVALLAFQVPLETWEKMHGHCSFFFDDVGRSLDSFHRQRGEWCEAMDFIGRDEFSAF